MSIDLIKKLRAVTGAGISECSEALSETGGDLDKALSLLRERGTAKAAKRGEKEVKDGIIAAYVHATGKVGVLLELRSESDFVARTKEFGELAHELCLQIAAMNPSGIAPAEDTVKDGGEPPLLLLEQPYIRDEKRLIRDLIAEYSAKFGEKIEVARFARFEL